MPASNLEWCELERLICLLAPLSRPWTARMSLLTLRRAMPMPRSWYERPRGARARCLCSGSQQHEASCACLSEKVPGDRMHQLLPLRGSVCDSAVGTARSWRRTFFFFLGAVPRSAMHRYCSSGSLAAWPRCKAARIRLFVSLALATSLCKAGESLLQEVRRHGG